MNLNSNKVPQNKNPENQTKLLILRSNEVAEIKPNEAPTSVISDYETNNCSVLDLTKREVS